MRNAIQFVTAAVLTAILFVATCPSRAQNVGFAQQTVQLTGKIKAMSLGMLQVVEEKGDQFLVRFDPQVTAITMKASTTIGVLKSGMIVRLTNEFDSQGHASHPQDVLEIITPNEQTRLGAVPATAPGVPEKAGDAPAKPEPPAAKDEKKKAEKEAGGKKKGVPTASGPTTAFTVTGRVASVKDEVLKLSSGRASLQIQLTPETRVDLEQADFRMAKEGDAIKVDGFQVPGAASQILARRIEITAAQAIAAPQPPQRHNKSNRKSSGAKTEKD